MAEVKRTYRMMIDGVIIKGKEFPIDTVWELSKEGWTDSDITAAIKGGIIILEEETVPKPKKEVVKATPKPKSKTRPVNTKGYGKKNA